MNRTIHIVLVITIYAIFFISFPAWSQKNQQGTEWTGTLKDGTVITANDLKNILRGHERWHKHAVKIAKAFEERRYKALKTLRKIAVSASLFPANIAGADLRGADFRGANLGSPLSPYGRADLTGANLNGADLSGANLAGAYLENVDLTGANLVDAHLGATDNDESNYYKAAKLNGANFTGADLSGADFYMADLSKAILTKAILSKANLMDAILGGMDLRGVSLNEANLQGVDLERADLRGVYLVGANLSFCTLSDSDMRSAILSMADLSYAKIREANLTSSSLERADLTGADLQGTNLFSAYLSEADFKGANLSNADLRLAILAGADLKGTVLFGADFTNAFLENTKFMATPGHPEFQVSKRLSSRDSERLTTYYREAMELLELVEAESFYSRIISWLKLIFFDLPCQYGMNPGRSLIILMCLIPYFAIFYLFALRSNNQKSGFWLISSNACPRNTGASERSFKLSKNFPPRSLPIGLQNKVRVQIVYLFRTIRIAFFFSLLSAFRLGLGDVHRKRWITSSRARGYTIRATGWVRNLSVIQCLISTYLLGLWLMTTLINPF